MKQKAILIGIYALLNVVGGLIGYFIAGSPASLIASTLAACILFICSALIWKGNTKAYVFATTIIACLCAFFAYRFFLTQKIAPGAIMTVISGTLLLYLISQKPCCATKESQVIKSP